MVGMISRSSDIPQDYHSLLSSRLVHLQNYQVSTHQPLYSCKNEYFIKMNHPWVLLFLAVCALWTFGETVSCDQCGRECADICGTRQFRACCFNNMRKRHSEFLV